MQPTHARSFPSVLAAALLLQLAGCATPPGPKPATETGPPPESTPPPEAKEVADSSPATPTPPPAEEEPPAPPVVHRGDAQDLPRGHLLQLRYPGHSGLRAYGAVLVEAGTDTRSRSVRLWGEDGLITLSTAVGLGPFAGFLQTRTGEAIVVRVHPLDDDGDPLPESLESPLRVDAEDGPTLRFRSNRLAVTPRELADEVLLVEAGDGGAQDRDVTFWFGRHPEREPLGEGGSMRHVLADFAARVPQPLEDLTTGLPFDEAIAEGSRAPYVDEGGELEPGYYQAVACIERRGAEPSRTYSQARCGLLSFTLQLEDEPNVAPHPPEAIAREAIRQPERRGPYEQAPVWLTPGLFQGETYRISASQPTLHFALNPRTRVTQARFGGEWRLQVDVYILEHQKPWRHGDSLTKRAVASRLGATISSACSNVNRLVFDRLPPGSYTIVWDIDGDGVFSIDKDIISGVGDEPSFTVVPRGEFADPRITQAERRIQQAAELLDAEEGSTADDDPFSRPSLEISLRTRASLEATFPSGWTELRSSQLRLFARLIELLEHWAEADRSETPYRFAYSVSARADAAEVHSAGIQVRDGPAARRCRIDGRLFDNGQLACLRAELLGDHLSEFLAAEGIDLPAGGPSTGPRRTSTGRKVGPSAASSSG